MAYYDWLKEQIEYLKEHPTDECQIWIGDKRSYSGHGRVYNNDEKRYEPAHRAAYRLFYGKEAENLVCHHCDVGACINPYHLYDGTRSDNARDRAASGRMRLPDEYRRLGNAWKYSMRERVNRPGPIGPYFQNLELSLAEMAELLAKTLESARVAIESLEPEALGRHPVIGHFYRDELLANIDTALATWSHLLRPEER